MKTWRCKIGETDAKVTDLEMRNAISDAYEWMTGKRPDFILSGWDDDAITCHERAAIEDRMPSSMDILKDAAHAVKEADTILNGSGILSASGTA